MVNTLCEIKVSYKNPVSITESTVIKESKNAVELLRKIWDDNLDYCESFYMLCLNRSNQVLGWLKVSQGGLCGTVVDIRQIFGIALKANACNILIAHNHPSTNLKPSETDIKITKKVQDAGRFFDITLLDHIILTSERYFSFADEGML